MEKWRLTIEKADNGFILTGEGADNNGPFVIQEQDDELCQWEELVYQVWEFFGHYGSKHDKERLRVVREKQK